MRIYASFVLLIASIAAQAANDPIGCYTVQINENSGITQGKSLHLTSEPASTPWGTDGGKQILPTKAGERFNYSAAYWVISNKDLVLTFSSNGLSGVEIRVHQVKGGFEGVIQNFWDFGPGVDDIRPVKLTKIECSSVR